MAGSGNVTAGLSSGGSLSTQTDSSAWPRTEEWTAPVTSTVTFTVS